jgi:cbb3-type cytochrome oxidase subunit 3
MAFMHALQWIEHYSIAVVFLVFLLVLITTYWPGRRSSIERNGRIPLDDDRQGVSSSAHQD